MTGARRLLDMIALWLALAGGFVVFVMMLMVTADAIGRKTFGALPGGLEFSEALMVPTVFLPLMFVQAKREHVFVSVATTGLGMRTRCLFDAVAALVGLAVFGLLTWLSLQKAVDSFLIREYRVAVISVPIWPFRWFVPFGTGLMVLQLALTALEEFRRAVGDREPLPHEAELR